MNNQFYDLNKPITQVITNVLIKFSINNLIISPFQQATMNVNLFNETNNFITSKYMVMNGDDYTNWQGDDQYLINWINQQLENN